MQGLFQEVIKLANVQIDVPEILARFIKSENERDRLMINAMLIFPLIKKDVISYGRAAEILNVRKMDLITLYGSLGIPYFDLSKEELDEDLKNIKSFTEYLR